MYLFVPLFVFLFFCGRVYISKVGNEVFPHGWLSVGPDTFLKIFVSQWVQNHFLLIVCLCPLLNTGQMDVPSSHTSDFIRDYYEKSLLILSSCSEHCLRDYLTAGSLFFPPLIHFMPFLFAQQFTTLVMVRCISHSNDSAFRDKHLTCNMDQI